MVIIFVLVVVFVGLLGLAIVGLLHERRELADRERRRAFVRWQQRQAEHQIQKITHAAFSAMLTEARTRRAEGDWPCHD
jgi:Tfp pilus assembly protein PilX